MYSSKLSVSVHLLLLVATSKLPITSNEIALSINTNPVVVRKLMGKLNKAGIIDAKRNLGVTNFSVDLDKITLLDIFNAIEDNKKLFDIHPNPNLNCEIGSVIQEKLNIVYEQVDKKFLESLQDIKLIRFLKKGE